MLLIKLQVDVVRESPRVSQIIVFTALVSMRVHVFTLTTPIGFDKDMVTKMERESGETLGIGVIRAKHRHNILTKSVITDHEN